MKSIVTILIVILSSSNIIAQNAIGESPTELLLKASLHGEFREIKKAMALDADVNAKNANGDTPLSMVAKLSYYFIAKYFVDNGANVNVSNNDKISPLHFAVEYNNLKMVNLFLKNGADINAKDSKY
jgi:ankyrin repeat protein